MVALVAIRGIVTSGDQRGRTLGFPTANIELLGSDLTSTLADGVWAGWMHRADGSRALSAISIGHRPTFYGPDGLRLIEAHLIDFHGDLYAETVTVTLDHWLRPQRSFTSVETLIKALDADVSDTRRWGEIAVLDEIHELPWSMPANRAVELSLPSVKSFGTVPTTSRPASDELNVP